MNCGDVSLAILAATLHVQYKVHFVCQLRSRNVCRKHELKMKVDIFIVVQKLRKRKECNTPFHRNLTVTSTPLNTSYERDSRVHIYYPFGAGIIFLILAHPIYKM